MVCGVWLPLIQELRDFFDGEVDRLARLTEERSQYELAFTEAIRLAVLRVDDPDLRNVHRCVIVELAHDARHGVFRGKNFEDGQWRMGNDLLDRPAAVQDSDIGNAEPCW